MQTEISTMLLPAQGEWQFVSVLPNLDLTHHRGRDSTWGTWPDGLMLDGTDTLVIVSQDDDRAKAALARTPGLHRVFSAFQTNLRRPYHPAILLERADHQHPRRQDGESVVAFRNAIAFQFLLRARAAIVAPDVQAEPTYSETFSFHPLHPTPNGGMVTLGEGLTAHYATQQDVIFTPTPQVSLLTSSLFPDPYLKRALSALWKEAYEQDHSTDLHRSVFLSLEMAYIACLPGAYNLGALTDYGASLSLWVSALEIMAWPRERHANFRTVQALLRQYEWLVPALNAEYCRRKIGRVEYSLRPAEYVYFLMYSGRNAFLHGNALSPDLLLPPTFPEGANLLRLAAVVYRTALAGTLQQRYPRAHTFEEAALFADAGAEMEYSQALLRTFDLDNNVERV